MAKRSVTSSGQKLHESAPARGLARTPGWNEYAQRVRGELEYLNGKAPSLTVPGYDNRGQRHVRNDGERLSVEPAPKRRGATALNPRFVAQGSGSRRCSICAGPHAEYRCPIPPAEKAPAVLGLLSDRQETAPAPASYCGRGRVLALPPGAFGSDLERVGRLAKRKRTRENLDGMDALIAGALMGAKRRRR